MKINLSDSLKSLYDEKHFATMVEKREEDGERRANAEVARRRSDLSWWREACQYLRPTPEDDQILNEESGEQIN